MASAMLYAITLFTSAFLLFLVQPILSKHILPWFGGSASVWATCLVFFQTWLLLGYAYVDQITRRLAPSRQWALHALLLIASLLTLPVLAENEWKPDGSTDPVLHILLLLVATAGLPYLMLSSTGPLIQSWAAQAGQGPRVYRLFSLSNLASLLALLAYPFLIEPWLSLKEQSSAWSVIYVCFVALCIACGAALKRNSHLVRAQVKVPPQSGHSPDSSTAPVLWIALSAMGSWLLLAITNHITQNIAAIPFLWILPLTLYLLTFIFCFESDRWYRRRIFLPFLLVTLAACAVGLNRPELSLNLEIAIPLYCMGLFLACMVLHGELAALRPPAQHLARFYLFLALGGALGGIFVGLVAPRIFPSYYESGAGFVIVALLVAYLVRRHRAAFLSALLIAECCALLLVAQVRSDHASSRLLERNFHGRLRVLDTRDSETGDTVRQLFHGMILHGDEYLDGPYRLQPTSYYGRSAGVGRVLSMGIPSRSRRIGIVGLGAGTLAAYGQTGDRLRFYDIDPMVIKAAHQEFGYLRHSKASVETVLGDARLSLERESANHFDVLVIDAFSGDSIPTHLITREALAIYLRHMNDNGVIAFHVTNRFLSLAPVVHQLAIDQGLHAVLVKDAHPAKPLASSEWMLLARDRATLMAPEIHQVAQQPPAMAGLGVWTDNSTNLFKILK